MTKVSVLQDKLIVEMEGWDKIWALKSRLEFPLAHVREARPGAAERPQGLRLPGTYIPYLITAGTFVKSGRKVFWAVHDIRQAVVIDLHDEAFAMLVVQVRDPLSTVKAVQASLLPIGA